MSLYDELNDLARELTRADFAYRGAMNRRHVAALVLAIVPLFAACSASDAPSDAGSTTATEAPVETEAPVVVAEVLIASGETTADGVPLPVGAGLDPESDSVYMVEGASYDQVREFYTELLPDGQPWQDWQWCEYGPLSSGVQWVLSQGDDLLVVNVLSSDDDPRPMLSIGQDFGPC